MACTAKRSEQISEFASGKLSETEADDLLDHILTCSDCSEEFDLVADLVTCLDRHGDELSRMKESSVFDTILTRIRNVLNSMKTLWLGLPVPVRILVPAAVVVVFASIVFSPSGIDGVRYSQLARYEAPGYILGALRGPGVNKSTNGPFDEAMDAYEKRDFSKVIERLSEVVKAHPEFGEAFFYLGISYHMKDEWRRAIETLQNAAVLLEDFPLGEQCLWYLGMAYLQNEEGQKALDQFQKIVDLNSHFKVNAEMMVERIKRVQHTGSEARDKK